MQKSNTHFNERRENLFKENIPAFSIQGKSRSISVLQKNLVAKTKNLYSQINHTLQWYREVTYKNTTQHIHDK